MPARLPVLDRDHHALHIIRQIIIAYLYLQPAGDQFVVQVLEDGESKL